jgi:hypothetical protein
LSEFVVTLVTPSTFLAARFTATSQPPQNMSGTFNVTAFVCIAAFCAPTEAGTAENASTRIETVMTT